MLIYNSLTEKKEVLKKPFFRRLKLFVCGPTVYDSPHIGNLRTFMSFDIIVRYLRSRGFKVFYLQNITDVDDKIIARAEQERTSWKNISERYEKEFIQNNALLNIGTVDRYARATDHIPAITSQVTTLIKKGYAYRIDGDGWYFDLSKFPDYGKLAHRTIAQAEDGVSRIDTSRNKKNTGDFCLWKFSSSENKKYEPSWDAPFGSGRPGWHIEDTAITESFFGIQYDIHGGGVDLKFPHHEAEIAQQESASGKKPFVKLWMHVGFLQVNGQKMSKSLGNFVTVHDILSKLSPDEFRLLILQHHYRAAFNFSDDAVSFTKTNFRQIVDFLAQLALVAEKGSGKNEDVLRAEISTFEVSFHKAMEDDFNTPEALAALHTLMNAAYNDLYSLSPRVAQKTREVCISSLKNLGFKDILPAIPEKVAELVAERELSRIHKQFTHADALRNDVRALGYEVEDTPLGPFVRKSIK